MRIPVLVQNTRTRKFLKKDGKWTSDGSRATAFDSAKAAIEFCLGKKLKHVELVHRFEGLNQNVSIPLKLEGIGRKN